MSVTAPVLAFTNPKKRRRQSMLKVSARALVLARAFDELVKLDPELADGLEWGIDRAFYDALENRLLTSDTPIGAEYRKFVAEQNEKGGV